jgi:Tol biopolymer transport system component
MDSSSLDQAEKNLKLNIIKIDLDSIEQRIIGRIPKKPEMYNLNFSPDVKKIVFIHLPEKDRHIAGKYSYQIYIADVDSSNIRKLTSDYGPKHQPTFTRDNSKIIFIHEEGSKQFIKIMNIDGSDVKTLFEK